MMKGISEFLERRGAWLKGQPPDYALALSRQDLTRAISRNYPVFEKIRDVIIDGDAEAVSEVNDVWTFARDVRSRDPNWKLIATEAEQ